MIKLFLRDIKITNKKLAMAALLLALMMIFSFLSKQVGIPIFPMAGFLKLEYVDFISLVAYRLIGSVLTSFLIIVNSWLRMLYCGDGPVDAFTLMLAGLIYLWVYILVDFYLRRLVLLRKNQLSKRNDWIVNIISVYVASVVVSLLMALFNYLFIYDWYLAYLGMGNSWKWIESLIIPIVIPFNLIKFVINSTIFLLIFHVVLVLEKRMHIDNSLLWTKMASELSKRQTLAVSDDQELS